jgi:glucose-1-phosphate cytidylyltransferase
MKAVILAGGFGTRLSEETAVRPKPMVEIGGQPILWHIMKIYSAHGISDFIVCCGYKGHVIKQYFATYFLYNCNVTFDLRENRVDVHSNGTEQWNVTLVDTGEHSMTAGRLRRVRQFLDDETFCFTYGDGVADIDLTALIRFHRESGTLATLTASQPPGRFGAFPLKSDEHLVRAFQEKPNGDGAWVNAGFFVLEPQVLEYISDDSTTWEREPMQRLARDGQLSAFRHVGFWQPMDTLRDKRLLESLWDSGNAPWKTW